MNITNVYNRARNIIWTKVLRCTEIQLIHWLINVIFHFVISILHTVTHWPRWSSTVFIEIRSVSENKLLIVYLSFIHSFYFSVISWLLSRPFGLAKNWLSIKCVFVVSLLWNIYIRKIKECDSVERHAKEKKWTKNCHIRWNKHENLYWCMSNV